MPTIMIQMFLNFSIVIIEINFSFLIVQNSTRTATTTSTFLKHLKITSFFHSKVAKTVSKSVEKLKTNVLENLIKSFRGILYEGNIRDYREYLICIVESPFLGLFPISASVLNIFVTSDI